jgi:hypothetical protein
MMVDVVDFFDLELSLYPSNRYNLFGMSRMWQLYGVHKPKDAFGGEDK